jgi:hypothetical protein
MSRLAMGCTGGFLTTDFTDLKDFTDGGKVPMREISQGTQKGERQYYGWAGIGILDLCPSV